MADNLRVKEVPSPPAATGRARCGSSSATTGEQAERDRQVRTNLVTHLHELINGSDTWTPRRRDELLGSLRAKPGLRRYLRRTRTGRLRIDQTAARREAHLDGKWLLRTSDLTLTGEDLAAAYKQLLAVEYQLIPKFPAESMVSSMSSSQVAA